MARARDAARDKAKEMYLASNGEMKIKDIAAELGKGEGTVRGWKNKDAWDDELNGTLQTNERNAPNEKSAKNEVESEETDEFGMTPKQRKFADCYIKLGNATEAAKLAGYSQKVARQQGAENLSKPYLKSYIDKQLEAMSSEDIADATEVMKYFTSVMRRQQQEYVPVTLSKEESKWVDGKKQTSKTEEVEIVEIPARLSDANKAAEFLGRHYRLTQHVDEEKRRLELEKMELDIARSHVALEKETGGGDEYEDDGFIDALKGAEADWDE